jgi:hypothetical protein
LHLPRAIVVDWPQKATGDKRKFPPARAKSG